MLIRHYTKVWIFLFVVSFLIIIFGYQLGDRVGLFVAFFIALAFILLNLFFGKSRLLNQFKTQQIIGPDSWGVNSLIQKYCFHLNMKPPQFYITHQHGPIAFCTETTWSPPAIVLSSQLLQKLSSEELNVTVALLLSRAQKLDNFFSILGSYLANSVLGLGQILDFFSPINPLKKNIMNRFFQRSLAPTAWIIITLFNSSRTDYEIDLQAAHLVGSRSKVGDLIWRLHGWLLTEPISVPAGAWSSFIVSTDRRFSVQPSTQRRLTNLMGYYPI